MSMRQNFVKGIIKENPVFVFLLGMCPTLATTKSIESGLGMGILVILVLLGSNVVISLVKNFVPDEVRIPSYIVIIATFVTMIKMFTDAFAPDLAASLGVFIPLIVVNCIILGRAESFASKNNVLDSAIDGLGMGVGFTLALLLMGTVREVLGTGEIVYGKYLPLPVTGKIELFPEYAISIFNQAPGAFLVLGLLLAIFASMKARKEAK